MPYQLNVEQKDDYLHFSVKGQNSPQTVRSYLKDVLLTCIQRNCSTVLIEENLEGPGLDASDIFHIASEGSAQTNLYVRRIAYVDTNSEHLISNMRFAETVAVNRGTNIRIFQTVREAEGWLRDPVNNPARDFLASL